MTTPSVDDLQMLWGSRGLYATDSVTRAILNLLGHGRPVTAEALAAATGKDVEDARAEVETARRCGAEVQGGAVVGLALSLRQTQHSFRVRGNDLYTWCGFDALFLPILLDARAAVASTCPVTGVEIRLTVAPDGSVTQADPDTVAVGIVGHEVTSRCTRSGPASAICTQMPFFASQQAGQRWLSGRPGVAVVDLDQARKIARAYVGLA